MRRPCPARPGGKTRTQAAAPRPAPTPVQVEVAVKRLGPLPLLCLAALPAALLPAAAPPAGPSSAEVARLIGQLGDDDFDVREAATKALETIGEPAYEALRKAAREKDPEVRRRAERVVQTIEARWRIRRIAGRMGPRFREAIE